MENGGIGRREDRREGGEQKGKREKNLKKWDGRDRGRIEKYSKERDILIEGAIVGLARNLVLGKFPGNHKDDPS